MVVTSEALIMINEIVFVVNIFLHISINFCFFVYVQLLVVLC